VFQRIQEGVKRYIDKFGAEWSGENKNESWASVILS